MKQPEQSSSASLEDEEVDFEEDDWDASAVENYQTTQFEKNEQVLDDHGTAGITALGNKVGIPDTYDPTVLEVVRPSIIPTKGFVVQLECLEFTSLCPVTGQPDYGKITIKYQPSMGRLVESKSLKLYLTSYRNHRIFHEEVVVRIYMDLHALLSPEFLTVAGNFNLRGGISIGAMCSHHDSEVKG